MPSASAKVEKIVVMETTDPLKLFSNMLEKRMRNLEKRKMKLDNYRSDVENGKELNEDQKMAVSKYDSVIGVLDFAKDLSKAMQAIVMDSVRQQKKAAKKEQLERQLHEIQRLQEAFLFFHILSCFRSEDVRAHFLNGENGAVQLTSEQLSQLDQLYKLIGPGLPNDQADLTSHFHTLAENHIFLVEGKNKEIAGTTYKVLKELLQSIKDCGYFTRPSEPIDDGTSSEDMADDEHEPIEEHTEPNMIIYEQAQSPIEDQPLEVVPDAPQMPHEPVPEASLSDMVPDAQTATAPLQEVLVPESSFNFLQESQIDLDAPHMDPAVVAVHQMAPPSTTFTPIYPADPDPTPVTQQPVVNGHHGPEFDPTHPIPTQTFTNQSFAVMQNMNMMTYVPVTMHHGPVAVVPVSSVAAPPVVVAPVVNGIEALELDAKHQDIAEMQTNGIVGNGSEMDPHSNEAPAERGVDGDRNGYSGYRGGFRGRGRGRGNGYFRGRGNFQNGRGGYQNHYYQDRNGYNGNFRRGNNRGGPRGSGTNYRGGRGNYRDRPQGPISQHQQQHPTSPPAAPPTQQ